MKEKQIENIARLARLRLTDEEKKKLPAQLEQILGYIDHLKECDTSHAAPADQRPDPDKVYKLREEGDKLEEFKDTEKLTEIAPDFKDGFYRVKKVIE